MRRIVEEFSEFARLPRPKPQDVDLGTLARRVLGMHDGVRARLAVSVTGDGSNRLTKVTKRGSSIGNAASNDESTAFSR